MKCNNCGTEFNGLFCPQCGTKYEPPKKTCPTCGSFVTGKFCSNCGTNLSVIQSNEVQQNIQEYYQPMQQPAQPTPIQSAQPVQPQYQQNVSTIPQTPNNRYNNQQYTSNNTAYSNQQAVHNPTVSAIPNDSRAFKKNAFTAAAISLWIGILFGFVAMCTSSSALTIIFSLLSYAGLAIVGYFLLKIKRSDIMKYALFGLMIIQCIFAIIVIINVCSYAHWHSTAYVLFNILESLCRIFIYVMMFLMFFGKLSTSVNLKTFWFIPSLVYGVIKLITVFLYPGFGFLYIFFSIILTLASTYSFLCIFNWYAFYQCEPEFYNFSLELQKPNK